MWCVCLLLAVNVRAGVSQKDDEHLVLVADARASVRHCVVVDAEY